MKVVIQRVKNASVEVDNKIVGEIEKGFLVLLGVGPEDTTEIADFLVEKLCNLRVFKDDQEMINNYQGLCSLLMKEIGYEN